MTSEIVETRGEWRVPASMLRDWLRSFECGLCRDWKEGFEAGLGEAAGRVDPWAFCAPNDIVDILKDPPAEGGDVADCVYAAARDWGEFIAEEIARADLAAEKKELA